MLGNLFLCFEIASVFEIGNEPDLVFIGYEGAPSLSRVLCETGRGF
jgi:hypothetical protein